MRFLILLAIIGAALAVPRHAQRIIGGESTTVEQHPYMANLQYGWFNLWWVQSCGGTVITAVGVLTAAHCVEGETASSWRVILGSSENSFQISDLIVHEEFNSVTLANDIAIVRLATPASSDITVARIAGPNYIVPDGTPFTIVGWGDLTYGGLSSNELQQAVVNQISQEYCVERYAELKNQDGYQNWPDVTERMICAGFADGGVDACTGDAGGPLLHDTDIVVGVTSWGYRCGEPGYPGVYARVGPHVDWIVLNSA